MDRPSSSSCLLFSKSFPFLASFPGPLPRGCVSFLACSCFGYTVCFYFRWNSTAFEQCVFLDEKIDNNCWNIDHVWQTTWKWSNWRLTREQDGTDVSLISHIHVRFLSCVISFIVLPTLPSPSSTVFLKFPNILGIYLPMHVFSSFRSVEIVLTYWTKALLWTGSLAPARKRDCFTVYVLEFEVKVIFAAT